VTLLGIVALMSVCACARAQPRAAWRADAWVAETVRAELRDAVEKGRTAALRRQIDAVLLARVACGRLEHLEALTELVYAQRACRFLPLTGPKTSDRAVALWLLDRRELSRRLFRALEDVPRPAESMRAVCALAAAEEKAVLHYPDLAVAFATTLPLRHERPQPNPATMVESFRWYADSRNRFKHDLRALPYELLRHLADTRLSLEERRWAVQRFGKNIDTGRAYFAVPYDRGHLRSDKQKKIAKLTYTLPNLDRVGGVCVDQAYFASQVNKALGIPSTIVYGRGGAGVPHAWFAYFRRSSSGKVSWDASTGRYSRNKYFIGRTVDPANGQDVYDSVLALHGQILQLPLQRREEADTAVVLARVVREAVRNKRKADVGPLTALAQTFRTRFPRGGPADASWVGVRRQYDRQLVVDLVREAIRRNVAHAKAWDLVLELQGDGELTADQLGAFFQNLVDKTARRYPDFSYTVFMGVLPTLLKPADRERICKQALGVYKKRPDLQGRILIALGRDYLRQGRKDEAVAKFEEAAKQCVDLADIVVEAARCAEDVLIRDKENDRAVNLYRGLWARTKKRKLSDQFQAQTSHYLLGSRLAHLLDADGKTLQARWVRHEINQ
jgi:hypothetical protein